MASLETRLPRARVEARVAKTTLIAALLLSIAVYARVMSGEFQLDDAVTIERNLGIKDLGRFLSVRAWALGTRALTDLTLAVNYALGRLDPFGYHATNLVIHLAATVLLFLLGRRLLRAAAVAAPDACAAAAAALFAVHPIQTESVSYVIQRAESLSSALLVAALLLLLEAERDAPAWRRAVTYAGALAVAAAALAAKQVAAILPAVYLVSSQAFARPEERGGRHLRRRLLLCAPLVLLSGAAASGALSTAAGSSHAGFDIPGITPWQYLLTQTRVVFRYLALIAVPIGQNADPDVAVSRSVTDPATTAVAALALLAAAAVASSTLLRRSGDAGRPSSVARVASFGAVWFLLLLLPSSLVPLVDVMVEHRVYLASWGVFLAVVTVADALAERWKIAPVARVVALAAVVATHGVATWTRNAVWETKIALWSDTVEKSPSKPRPYAWLGSALELTGDHARAADVLRRGLALDPDARTKAEMLTFLGSSLMAMGRHDEAAAALAEAARHPFLESHARTMLAVSLLGRGFIDAGLEQVTRAIEADPNNPAPRVTLGEVLLRRGEDEAALEEFRVAVRLNPDGAPARLNAALALERLGRLPEACGALAGYLALERNPASVAAARGVSRRMRCGEI